MSCMTVLESLKKTREELATRGRTTGTLLSIKTYKVCLLGAVGVATGHETEMKLDVYAPFYAGGPADPVVQELLKDMPESYLHKAYSHAYDEGTEDDIELGYGDLHEFNDSFADDAEVFALIDRSIARLEAA